ncbi:MAG TPA: hypothetical protein VIV60_35295 [Polyangiaceae bacterium]
MANLLLAGSFLFAAPLRAQESSATAERLFEQGRRELSHGDYEAACMHLRESNELDPAPGTELNLGECETRRGRLVTAWALFARVERELSANDLRLPIARQKREALELRLGRLSIHFTGANASESHVRVQSQRFELRELRDAILLEPGNVEVTVMEPGKPERLYTVSIVAGATAVLDIAAPLPQSVEPPRPIAPSVVPSPVASAAGPVGKKAIPPLLHLPSSAAPASRSHSPSRLPAKTSNVGLGYVFLGSGVGFAALGGILGILTLDAKRVNEEHCDEALHRCDATGRSAAHRGRILGALTTAAWVTGGFGITLGTYTLMTAPRKSASMLVRVGREQVGITAQYSY